MKLRLIAMLLCFTFQLPAQVSGGIHAGFGPNAVRGDLSAISEASGWRGGVWVEPTVSERMGLYADLSYSQRGGSLSAPDVEIEGEYICLGVMPRVKIATRDDAAFVVGLGGYIGILTEKAEENKDAGLYGQLGVEWRRGGACFFVQRGFSDITSFLPGSQNWFSGGVMAYLRLFRSR